MNKFPGLILLIGFIIILNSCQQNNLLQKPNIVFILVDDLGYHDLSINGSNFYETPNIDSLAKRSYVFDQGYASSRVCSPSRASILSGQFTATHGVTDWIGAKEGESWHQKHPYTRLLPATYRHQLDTALATLPEVLREHGYKTFFAGKWHLGNEWSYPENHGFDINVGGWAAGSPAGGYFAPFKNPRLPDDIPHGTNLSNYLSVQTTNFIRNNKDAPFFAMLSFYAVHGPIQTTETKWQKYRGKAIVSGLAASGFEMERRLPIRSVQDNPIYAGLVEEMDDAVGILLRMLDSLNLMENTIIVFTSDNGGVASGDAYSTSNLPLRGGKGYQWEGGIREPYFIKTVGPSKNVKISSTPVSGIDFFPTLLELAGIKNDLEKQLEGQSLVPLMKGVELPQRPLFWHYPHYGNQGGDPSSIVRLGDWKLIHYWGKNNFELYNLKTDPTESKDVSEIYPEKAREMDVTLLTWLVEKQAIFPEEVSDFDTSLITNRYFRMKDILMSRLEKERLEILNEDFRPNEDWWESQATKD